MNIAYIVGLVLSFVFILLGMLGFPKISFDKLMNFVDMPSVLIVVGCTFAVVAASMPTSVLLAIPKHLGMVTAYCLWKAWPLNRATRFLRARLCY